MRRGSGGIGRPGVGKVLAGALIIQAAPGFRAAALQQLVKALEEGQSC